MRIFLSSMAVAVLLAGCDVERTETDREVSEPARRAPATHDEPDSGEIGRKVGEGAREFGREAREFGESAAEEAKEFGRGVEEGFKDP